MFTVEGKKFLPCPDPPNTPKSNGERVDSFQLQQEKADKEQEQ
jgi:hypothetical protein